MFLKLPFYIIGYNIIKNPCQVKNAKKRKNFIIADFSPSPGPVSEYGMTPCQARGRLFFHRDRLFPHRACPSRRQGRESTKKASISLWIPAGAEPVLAKAGNSLSPASARAGSGEGQGRCRKIIQSAIMKKSLKNAKKCQKMLKN